MGKIVIMPNVLPRSSFSHVLIQPVTIQFKEPQTVANPPIVFEFQQRQDFVSLLAHV